MGERSTIEGTVENVVFQNEENLPHGAVSMGQFVETVKAL